MAGSSARGAQLAQASGPRYRVLIGIDYVVSDADHARIQAANTRGEDIDPFDPENGIEMRRVEPGEVVELPARVVAALAGNVPPVLEEVSDG